MLNNLPAVHQMWEEYIKHYNMSIIVLRKFIWSFRKLGDSTSAFNVLQQMVSLANEGVILIDRKSTRIDIPVLSNRKLGSTVLDMEDNQQVNSFICPPSVYLLDANSVGIDQQIKFMGYKEAKSADMTRVNRPNHLLILKILTWSFSNVIAACAKDQNYGLAEQLILQVCMLIKLVILCY